MKQTLEALEFIHGLNLIHCDIKPENIVIKSFSKCRIKLIDFGSSCFVDDHLTTYIQSRSYRYVHMYVFINKQRYTPYFFVYGYMYECEDLLYVSSHVYIQYVYVYEYLSFFRAPELIIGHFLSAI